MHKPQRTRLGILAMALVIAVSVVAVFAGVASAYPNFTTLCSDCHAGVATAPTVAVTSGAGVDPVSYSVDQLAGGWAAYDLSAGTARIAGGTAATGNFTAPLGHYVRVCSSDGDTTGTYTQAYLLKPKLAATPHGSVSPAAATVVAPGGSQPFTFTADAGYHVSEVKIGGVSNPAAVTAGSYTYANVQADSTIEVTFAVDTVNHTIAASAGANGTISPSGNVSVAQGASQAFTFAPSAGYQVDTITVDGVVKPVASSFTFTNVTANHTIAVTFKAAAPARSSITVAVSGTLRAGKTATLKGTLKPARAAKVTLTIQRKSGAKWVKVTTKSATANATTGAYKCAYKLPKKGAYRVQAVAPGTSAYGKATSSWRVFTVK